MHNLLIQKNYITKEKYIKLIENIQNINNINVYYFSNKHSIVNDLSNQKIHLKDCVIVCDKKLNIKYSYNNIISGLKKIINYRNDMTYKMNILKDICKNIPVILFSCGPSSNIDFNKLKNIENKYIIIGVKYSRDILLKNNISVDFTIQSFWSNVDYMTKLKNPNEENTISIFIKPPPERGFNYTLNNDIIFTPDPRIGHGTTFRGLKQTKDINIIKITENKVKKILYIFFALMLC